MTTDIHMKENIQSEKYTFVIAKIIASSICRKTKIAPTYVKSFSLKIYSNIELKKHYERNLLLQ